MENCGELRKIVETAGKLLKSIHWWNTAELHLIKKVFFSEIYISIFWRTTTWRKSSHLRSDFSLKPSFFAIFGFFLSNKFHISGVGMFLKIQEYFGSFFVFWKGPKCVNDSSHTAKKFQQILQFCNIGVMFWCCRFTFPQQKCVHSCYLFLRDFPQIFCKGLWWKFTSWVCFFEAFV